MRAADALGDGPGVNVAVINVPAIAASAERRRVRAGMRHSSAGRGTKQVACQLSLFTRTVGTCYRMEKPVDRVVSLVMATGTATGAALSLAYIAHYDFGLSREEIRGVAMVGAGVIAGLVAIEFFGEKLRKPK
jgi:hypothetical protein